jgi:hypothetical protein
MRAHEGVCTDQAVRTVVAHGVAAVGAVHAEGVAAMRRSFLTLAALAAPAALLAAGSAAAHPHDAPAAADAGLVRAEVLRFREELQQAIAARDVVRLRQMYAEGFTHTHGSGRVDRRDARIVAVVAGDPVIEVAPVEELNVRSFGEHFAIVTARSPILNRAENRSYDFRWIAVYAKLGGAWQLAASQATRLPPAG